MEFCGTEWHNRVLKKIGVFKDYSCWENSSCISSGLDGYVFYENNSVIMTFDDFSSRQITWDQRNTYYAMAKEIGSNIAAYKKDMESEEVQ